MLTEDAAEFLKSLIEQRFFWTHMTYNPDTDILVSLKEAGFIELIPIRQPFTLKEPQCFEVRITDTGNVYAKLISDPC